MCNLWPARRETKLPRSVNLQWKGTDACVDFTCPCGATSRYRGFFTQFIRCGKCKDVYWLSNSVEIVELTDEEKLALANQDDAVHIEGLEWSELKADLQRRGTLRSNAKVHPIERALWQSGPAFIRFEETRACVDLNCDCESDDCSHVCSLNSPYMGCPYCQKIYWLTPNVEALKLTAEELEEHESRVHDPD